MYLHDIYAEQTAGERKINDKSTFDDIKAKRNTFTPEYKPTRDRDRDREHCNNNNKQTNNNKLSDSHSIDDDGNYLDK